METMNAMEIREWEGVGEGVEVGGEAGGSGAKGQNSHGGEVMD